MENKVVGSLSLSSLGILAGIILIILKLAGAVSISWFWAIFPLWIMPAIGVALVIVLFPFLFILALISSSLDIQEK